MSFEVLYAAFRALELVALAICLSLVGLKIYNYFLQKPGTHWSASPLSRVHRRLDRVTGYLLEPLIWAGLTYFFFRLLLLVGGYQQLPLAVRGAAIGALALIYVVSLLPWIGAYNLGLTLVTRNPPLHIDKDEYFPAHRLFEDPENWRRMRLELDELLAETRVPLITDFFRDVKNAPTDEVDKGLGWRAFVLRIQGRDVEANCKRVPFVASLLKQVPEVKTALYSILDAKKELTSHRGHFKGVLRYHLGMIVPTDGPSYLTCGGERYDWKEGEGVLFDDMYVHAAKNSASSLRAVLFIDVERPLIPGLQQLNQSIGWLLERHPLLKMINARIHRESSIA